MFSPLLCEIKTFSTKREKFGHFMSNTANVASELIRITITLLLSKDKCELSKTEKLWATPLNSININSGSFSQKGVFHPEIHTHVSD